MNDAVRGYISALWLMYLIEKNLRTEEGNKIYNNFVTEMSEKHVQKEERPIWNQLVIQFSILCGAPSAQIYQETYVKNIRSLLDDTGLDLLWRAVLVNEGLKENGMGELLLLEPSILEEEIHLFKGHLGLFTEHVKKTLSSK